MKRLLYFVILASILSSCIEDDSPYLQFTRFELGFLYYPYDTLTYVGKSIEYHDSVFFLVNGKDTMSAKVKTKIDDWLDPLLSYSQKTLNGTSELFFPKSCGIYLSVSMATKHAQSVGKQYFDLNINGNYYNKEYSCLDTIKPVSLFVQGLEYDSVFVFDIYDAGFTVNHLQINFARKYGFISIKVNDNSLIERLSRY